MWAVLSQFICCFHVHFCKIFSQLQIFSSWEKRSQRAVLGPGSGLCSCLCWLSLAQLRRCTSGQESRVSEPALLAELSPAVLPHQPPGWLPSNPQMSSSPHQHETSPPSLGNKQGPPSSINIDENGDWHFKVLNTLNLDGGTVSFMIQTIITNCSSLGPDIVYDCALLLYYLHVICVWSLKILVWLNI